LKYWFTMVNQWGSSYDRGNRGDQDWIRGVETYRRHSSTRGLLNRSDLVREAIRLYLSLTSLETEARLRMLRLINESAGVSGKTAGQLVEEARREEDA